MPNQDEVVTVKIEALAYGGAFVGKVVAGNEARIGQRAFVRHAAPSEEVLARITVDHGRFIEAELVTITSPSGARQTPPCSLFGRCGGCDLQHLKIEEQRRSKLDLVRATLKFQGGIEPTNGVYLVGENLPALNYRRRVSLHLNEAGELGFYQAGSGEVVSVNECFLAKDIINSTIVKLQPHLTWLAPQVKKIVIECNFENVEVVLIPESIQNISNARKLAEHLPSVHVTCENQIQEEGDDFSIAGHFSQVNGAGNAALVEHVLSKIPEGPITELYAGAGNFTIPLAINGRKIDAVEVNPALVRYGEHQLKTLKLEKSVRYFEASCERFLKMNKLSPIVLLDPPRAGAKEVVKRFKEKHVTDVIYVSCSLPTLTRDLKRLKEDGFNILETAVIDMFPQTHHVETVTVLKL